MIELIKDFVVEFFSGFLLGVLFGVLLVIFGLPYFSYKKSQTDAKIYNQKFGTSYTTSDFFWSESTIKSFVGEGEQKTFNVKLK